MDEKTPDWAVTFTYDAAPDEQSLQRAEELLDPAAVPTVAAVGTDRVTVTLHVPAEDPVDAVESGGKLLDRSGVAEAFGWLQVAVEAVDEAEHERRADAPTLPELVGASEVGAMLGVSRQRVHQLRESSAFPAPLVEVAMGPLWDARAVEAFARDWSRRPGRRAGRRPLAVASG